MGNDLATRDARSFAELTRAHFGESLSMDDVWRLLDDEEPAQEAMTESVWLGSVGYEKYKLNSDFSRMLSEGGVERLIDVRDLPISRRRGYAKTKLGEALAEEGIEYVHVKALGNPKPIRDMYKAGNPIEGRRLYEALLLTERRTALDDLAVLLASKRTALMCVEHDADVCHRTVIVDALRSELGLELDVVHLG